MTPVYELYQQLAKHGHYPVVVITIDDVMQFDPDEFNPTEEQAHEACKWVCDYWPNGSEWDAAVIAAVDYIKEEGK